MTQLMSPQFRSRFKKGFSINLFSNKILFLIFGRIAQAVLAIVTIKLATRYLLPDEMGNYYLLSSITSLFGIVFISPIGQFINRKFHAWHDNKNLLKNFITFNYYVLAVSLLSIPVIFIAQKFGGFITAISFSSVVFLSFAGIYLNTWIGTLIPAFNMLEKRIIFTVFTLINLTGGLMVALYLIFHYEAKGVYWYLGQIVIFQFVTFIVALFYFKNKIGEEFSFESFSLKVSKEQIKKLIHFSGPLAIATFFMWLLNDSYRFIVERMMGVEFLGILAIGFGVVASVFSLLESLFQQIYYPSFYRKITNTTSEDRRAACQNLIDTAFPLFFFMAIYLVTSAPFLVRLLTSQAYERSYLFVIFGVGINLTRVLTNIISTAAHSEMNTRKLVMPYMIGGMLIVFILPFCLYFFKSDLIIGVILMSVNFTVLIFMRFFISEIVEIHIPWGTLFTFLIIGLPFGIQVLFWETVSMAEMLLIVGIFGLYFVIVIFYKYKKIIPR